MVRNLWTLSSCRTEQPFDLVLRLKVPPSKLSDAYNLILPAPVATDQLEDSRRPQHICHLAVMLGNHTISLISSPFGRRFFC